MSSWLAIGAIVGTVLGLTGAGGAIIAVPLFKHLLSVSVHEATVFSLMAVATGAALNWLLQRKGTLLGTALMLAFGSVGGTALARPFKQSLPAGAIQFLIVGLALFSLYSVWRKGKAVAASRGRGGATTYALALVSGSGLGALTTMTGLGGGVVLVPWLIGPLGLSLAQAVPTSLLTITLVSAVALGAQAESVSATFTWAGGALLIAGSIASALGVRALVRRLSTSSADHVRRWTLTAVIVVSIAALVLK